MSFIAAISAGYHTEPPSTLNIQSLPYHPILPGSRVDPRLPPPGDLLGSAGKPALESAEAVGRGGAGRAGAVGSRLGGGGALLHT